MTGINALNAHKLGEIRDREVEKLRTMSPREVKADVLARITALNVLYTTACSDGLMLDEINLLTDAGRIVSEHYRT